MRTDADTNLPDFRATACGGQLVLTPWNPALVSNWGPCNRLLPGRRAGGVGIADLLIVREDPDCPEVIATELTAGCEQALRPALTEWAHLLGYRRVWYSDDVVELADPHPGFGGPVSTRCRVCRARWADGAPEFWLVATNSGVFPLWCPVCGNSLPQWAASNRPTPPRSAAKHAGTADHDDAIVQASLRKAA